MIPTYQAPSHQAQPWSQPRKPDVVAWGEIRWTR